MDDFNVKSKPDLSVVKKCPRCHALSFKYVNGKLSCSEWGYSLDIMK